MLGNMIRSGGKLRKELDAVSDSREIDLDARE